jgi:hypothetical protein
VAEIHIDIDSHNQVVKPRGGKSLLQKTLDDMDASKKAKPKKTKRAYRKNPRKTDETEKRFFAELDDAVRKAGAARDRMQRQGYVAYAQGMVEAGTMFRLITSAQNAVWMDRLKKIAGGKNAA